MTSKVRELIRKNDVGDILLPTAQSASANLTINPLILQMHYHGN